MRKVDFFFLPFLNFGEMLNFSSPSIILITFNLFSISIQPSCVILPPHNRLSEPRTTVQVANFLYTYLLESVNAVLAKLLLYDISNSIATTEPTIRATCHCTSCQAGIDYEIYIYVILSTVIVQNYFTDLYKYFFYNIRNWTSNPI